MLFGRFIKGVSNMIAPTDENIDDMVAAYKRGFRAGYRSDHFGEEAQRVGELCAIILELKLRGMLSCVTGLARCGVCAGCRAVAALEKPCARRRTTNDR